MSIRVVRLGSDRAKDEGLRVGTVRRPPRGVKKERLAADDWYDVWLPQLAPSAALVKEAQAADSPAGWTKFARKYRRTSSLLTMTVGGDAALSRESNVRPLATGMPSDSRYPAVAGM